MRGQTNEPTNQQKIDRKKYITISHFDQQYKKTFQKLDKQLLAQSLEGALLQPLKRSNNRLINPLTK